MILDALLQFSSGQSMVQSTGSYDSTNIIDLGVSSGVPSDANGGGARDLGVPAWPTNKLLVQVGTAFTSGGSATFQVELQGAPDSSGSPGSWYVFSLSEAYAYTACTAGARLWDIDLPRPPAGVPTPRFLKLTYIIGTASITAGTVSAYLTPDRWDQPVSTAGDLSGYQPGITVAN